MNPLHDLSVIDTDEWRELHRRALAAAHGSTLLPELERLAATDELLALTVPELVRLAVFAVCTEAPPEPSPQCARAGQQRGGRAAATRSRARRRRPRHRLSRRRLARARVRLRSSARDRRLQASPRMPAARHPRPGRCRGRRRRGDRAARRPLGIPEGLADALAAVLVLYAAGEAIGG